MKSAKLKQKPKDAATDIPKGKSMKIFVEISPENYFVLCDGRIIKDYKELANILESVNDDIFYYHVNNDKNDFANWINDIFKEQELADNLRMAKSRVEILALLYKNMFEKSEKVLKNL